MSARPSHHETAQDAFDAQLQRVFAAAKCRTQLALADFLGIKQSSVSDAKRRKSIPPDWLVKLFEKRRINPDWIYTGTGGQFLPPAVDGEEAALPAINTRTEFRPVEDCTIDELLTELVRRALKNIDG